MESSVQFPYKNFWILKQEMYCGMNFENHKELIKKISFIPLFAKFFILQIIKNKAQGFP